MYDDRRISAKSKQTHGLVNAHIRECVSIQPNRLANQNTKVRHSSRTSRFVSIFVIAILIVSMLTFVNVSVQDKKSSMDSGSNTVMGPQNADNIIRTAPISGQSID
jgi:hypothetical protein